MVIVLTCVSSVSITYSAINIIYGAYSSLLLSRYTVVLTTTTTITTRAEGEGSMEQKAKEGEQGEKP